MVQKRGRLADQSWNTVCHSEYSESLLPPRPNRTMTDQAWSGEPIVSSIDQVPLLLRQHKNLQIAMRALVLGKEVLHWSTPNLSAVIEPRAKYATAYSPILHSRLISCALCWWILPQCWIQSFEVLLRNQGDHVGQKDSRSADQRGSNDWIYG